MEVAKAGFNSLLNLVEMQSWDAEANVNDPGFHDCFAY